MCEKTALTCLFFINLDYIFLIPISVLLLNVSLLSYYSKLIRESASHHIRMRYRLPLILEKSALTMIIWNTFASLSYFSCSTQMGATWNEGRLIVYTIMLAMYPIVGLVSDCWLGRYKVLSASMCLLSVAVLRYSRHLKNLSLETLSS